MARRCPTCKRPLPKTARGRAPRYCSAACRQKAYRKRMSAPFRPAKLALLKDLDGVRSRDRAVKTLQALGYQVRLERMKPSELSKRAASTAARRARMHIVKPDSA